MKSFFKIFKILTPKQMRICMALVVMMFLIAAFEAVGIGLLYPLITIIGDSSYLEHHQKVAEICALLKITSYRSLVIATALGVLFFYIAKNALILLQGKLQIHFSLNNQKDYSKRLYSYYMGKPYLYHLQTNIAIVQRNISAGGQIVFSEMLVNTLIIITNLITIVVIWGFLCWVDWFMSVLVAFVIGPTMLLILNYFRKKISYYGNIQNECLADNGKWIGQGFWSLKETKVMQRESYFVNQFNSTYSKFSESQKQFLFINRFPKCIIELVSIGGILVLIAIKMIMKSNLESLIPTLGVLAIAAMRLMPCMNQITGLYNSLKFQTPLFNEMFDDLLAVKELKNLDEQNVFKKSAETLPFESEIKVENLTFRYPSNANKVLDSVSFTIPKGAFVGVVGPSGAGKSTFVDIMLGLLPPVSGAIYVDGRNIYENVSGWLNNVAYVPQTNYLIDSSIKENVAFGVPLEEIDEEKLTEVLKMSELYDFVQTLEDKEMSSVGDRGSRLSGGQKQRIGIARALYNNPKLLVLDEATSALDNETEKQITSTILKLKGKITIIAIAHRLTTLEQCDFKIRFENGKVVVDDQ